MINQQLGKDSIVISPAAMTNSATTTANFDTLGANYATLRIAFAIEKNTNGVGPTISVLESDDTVVTNFATIVADRSAETLVAAKALTYHVDLRGRKRYLRLSVTTATTTNDDVTLGCVGTLSRQEEAAAATTDLATVGVIV